MPVWDSSGESRFNIERAACDGRGTAGADVSATTLTMCSSLILKRASTSRPSDQWQDEDYDVLADGKSRSPQLYDDLGDVSSPSRAAAAKSV
jgi:hypothetical protein